MTVSELRASMENNIKIATEERIELLGCLKDDEIIPDSVEKVYEEFFTKTSG